MVLDLLTSMMTLDATVYQLLLLLYLFLYSVSSDVIRDSVEQNVVNLVDCLHGTYLSPAGSCQVCKTCSEQEYPVVACNATQDTVCDCRPGFYRDGGGVCKECNKCSLGMGASPACTASSNTICMVCPPGSYSNVESSIKSCQSCTECGVNEVSLQKCTAQQDTVCFKYQPKSESELASSRHKVGCKKGQSSAECAENAVTSDNSYLYTAPLYCSLLGAIIVGLLVYVVFRCRMNRKREAHSAALMHKQIAPYHHTVMPTQSNPNSYSLSQPLPRTTYSYVFLNQNGHAITASLRYKDLPSPLRRTIKRNLSHDGSWLKLATCLGYTPSEISRIQEQAERDASRSTPVSILLSDWSKRPYSTVENLLQALAGINRQDLIHLMQSSNSMSGSEVV